MKCPHCDYEHGWSGEILANIEGDQGDFYKLPVAMERDSFYISARELLACPKCRKTFIGD